MERSLSAVSAPASLISFTPVPRRRAVRLGPLFLYYCNVADIVESPRADAPSLRRVMCCLLSRPGAADADPERRANLLGKGGGRGGCFSFFFWREIKRTPPACRWQIAILAGRDRKAKPEPDNASIHQVDGAPTRIDPSCLFLCCLSSILPSEVLCEGGLFADAVRFEVPRRIAIASRDK